MATKKTPTARSARSRAEVKNEFDEVSSSVRSKEVLPASERAIQETHNSAIRDSVKGITLETAVQKVTEASLGMQKTFSNLAEQITAKVTELNQLQEAVTLERAELEKLHGADIIKSDLTALIAEHDEQVAKLETDIEQHRAEWELERTAYNKAEAERVAELNKNRAREAADYSYQLSQSRIKELDKWNQENLERDRKVKLEQELREKGWTVREETIKVQEKTFADLQAQVVAFPEALKKETATAVAIATNSLKKDLTSQFALEKKDLETTSSLAKQEIAALKATNSALLEQMGKLQVELAKAQDQVKSIAEKALESASGARALAEVQSFQSRDRETGNGRKQ